MLTKRERAAVKRRMRELLELVNEWDPAGLLAAGAPKDEYDCLVGPILRRLARGATAVVTQLVFTSATFKLTVS